MSARVYVDGQICELHGQCVEAAPTIFEFEDGARLRYRQVVADDEIHLVEDAQFLCPTQAIALLRGE